MAETTEERKQLRAGLLDQLRHLVREVDMLEGVIARVPQKLLAEAPPGEPHSIKEIFALIARLDEAVHPKRIRRIVEEDTPRFAPADAEALLAGTDWNAPPITDLFERVRTARRALIDTLEAVAPANWLRTGRFPSAEASEAAPQQEGRASEDGAQEERDLYWMAHALCQRDTARLGRMTRRLYESHMGPAPEAGSAPNGDAA